MKWSEWKSTIWGYWQTTCQDVTTAEVTISLCPIESGCEADVYVLFPQGTTSGLQVHREDIDSGHNLLDVQEKAIAWADGVIEKLGACLEVVG